MSFSSSRKVFELGSLDLHNMGIIVISYTLKDVSDPEGYLEAMGMAQTAQVKKDAIIGEAEAKRDSTIAEAKANEQKMQVLNVKLGFPCSRPNSRMTLRSLGLRGTLN